MRPSTISAPLVLRESMLADDNISDIIGTKMFPLVAPKDTEGDYILYARSGYEKNATQGAANWREKATVQLDCVSDDYDTTLQMVEAIRLHTIHMRNKGKNIHIKDLEEKAVAYVEGGQTTYVQVIIIECIDF